MCFDKLDAVCPSSRLLLLERSRQLSNNFLSFSAQNTTFGHLNDTHAVQPASPTSRSAWPAADTLQYWRFTSGRKAGDFSKSQGPCSRRALPVHGRSSISSRQPSTGPAYLGEGFYSRSVETDEARTTRLLWLQAVTFEAFAYCVASCMA